MDINHLKQFATIARTGSVRKAAELLHVTPPALSKTLRLLEDELGTELVVRSGRNIEITDTGRELARRAEDLVKGLEEIKVGMEHGRDKTETLRIATFETFSTYFLSALDLVELGDKRLVLHECLPGQLETMILNRNADLGITYLPIPMPGIEHVKVATIELGVFAREGAFKGVAQNELPFVVPVMPIESTPTPVRGLDGWPADAYSRKVHYEVTLLESALELCREGKAAAYFPAFVAHAHNKQVRDEFKLSRRPSPYKNRVCKNDVYLVKRKGTPESRIDKKLAAAIRRFCTS